MTKTRKSAAIYARAMKSMMTMRFFYVTYAMLQLINHAMGMS